LRVANDAMFGDRLKLTLTLLIGSDTLPLVSGSIKRLSLALTTTGFDAEVAFFVSSLEVPDPIFPDFSTQTVIKATLTVANGRVLFESDAAEPLTVIGYVTEKWVREVTGKGIADGPVVGRHYVMRFTDPAQAFWRQHQPVELYVGTSMQDAIDLNKAEGMTLSYDWGKLSEAQDVLCVGLGGEQSATFYDFVIWYVDRYHGVLELDASTSTYRLGKTKAIAAGEPAEIDEETVAEITIRAPEPVRYATSLLNPFTDAAVPQKAVPNTEAVTGVTLGAVEYTWIQAEFDERVQTETDKLVPSEHLADVTYKAVPDILQAPGAPVTLGADFSSQLYPFGQNYRVIGFTFSATKHEDAGAEDDLEEATAAYDIDMGHRLELGRDPTPRLPPFQRPTYPVYAEGRVLSASGAAADRTWFPMEDESTSLFEYRINVPLWNAIVVAPFIPYFFSGHFFFPAYKNQRVLVALEFDSARIDAYLEWAIPLSKDTQGDQLILGFNDTSHTYISHVYTDDKPVLTVARVLDGDTQTVTISEGDILMVVQQLQVATPPPPVYDVTPNVDVAKAQTSSQVNGSIADVTGNYESSTGAVMGSITGAQADVGAKVSAAQATLNAQIGAAEGQLSTLAANAAAAATALGAKVAGAQAEIQAAVNS
jgi:hypothetical protein